MKLFDSGEIGKLKLKNTLIMAPMGAVGLIEVGDGRWSPRAVDFYVTRARGGAGLIIPGTNFVSGELEAGMASKIGLVHNSTVLARLSELADAVHHY